jgi:hypothetical protein
MALFLKFYKRVEVRSPSKNSGYIKISHYPKHCSQLALSFLLNISDPISSYFLTRIKDHLEIVLLAVLNFIMRT